MARKRRKSPKRRFRWLLTTIVIAILGAIGWVNFSGGKLTVRNVWKWIASSYAPVPATRTATVPIPKSPDAVRIGTFNIQVFGQAKLENAEAMPVLADVARQFDILAIQEIRTQDDTHVDQFLRMINAGGRRFDKVVGPRLGRSNSTEQYAFVYDTETIGLVNGSVYTIEDRLDLLHREPLIASFQVRGNPGEPTFSFQLINIHTDPDETKQELDALGDLFSIVQQQSREDDVILVGDLNVDVRNFGRLGYLPGITPVVTRQFTNTRGTAMLDNIVFDRRRTIEFSGRGGVMNLREMYSLTEEQALDVSDHYPVWADFSRREGSPGAVATATETLSN